MVGVPCRDIDRVSGIERPGRELNHRHVAVPREQLDESLLDVEMARIAGCGVVDRPRQRDGHRASDGAPQRHPRAKRERCSAAALDVGDARPAQPDSPPELLLGQPRDQPAIADLPAQREGQPGSLELTCDRLVRAPGSRHSSGSVVCWPNLPLTRPESQGRSRFKLAAACAPHDDRQTVVRFAASARGSPSLAADMSLGVESAAAGADLAPNGKRLGARRPRRADRAARNGTTAPGIKRAGPGGAGPLASMNEWLSCRPGSPRRCPSRSRRPSGPCRSW